LRARRNRCKNCWITIRPIIVSLTKLKGLVNMLDEKIETDLPEGETGTEEESFAALFEKSGGLPGRIEPGKKVKSRVVSISGDFIYVDMDGKSEGAIDIREFKDEDGKCSVKVEDEIEAYFASVQNGVKRLTTMRHGLSTLDVSGIRSAYDAAIPVSGKVSKELKGGFEVHVGKVRCFCPFSQMDLRGTTGSESYLGQTFPFKVLEYKEDGRNVILSRRALLEKEQQARVSRLKESLSVGMEIRGVVRSMQSFGAFVDLGGIDGLIPISELGWGRTERTEDALSVGQEVTTKIIGIDWERNRVTLSLKAIQPDPFLGAGERYPVDSTVQGTIVRLAPFGAFVNLEPGVDGLIHISKLGAGRRIKHPKEVVEVGQIVEAYVQEVDLANKRISLTLERKVKAESVALPSAGDIVEGVVERVLSAGVLLRLSNGTTGFIPNSEMGTPRGTNHGRMFPVGTGMQVTVKEVDPEKNRVTLSRSGVAERLEQAELSHYQERVKDGEQTDGGLGSLGEILKAAMENTQGPQ
jgi:small subunit ribosomal protein S1